MKKFLFLILLGIFVSSCDSSQKKLENLLVELKTENPEEMEIRKKITEEKGYMYFNDSIAIITGCPKFEGYIGDTNEVYVFSYYPDVILEDGDTAYKKELIIEKSEKYSEGKTEGVKDVATEKINPETGYVVIGVRKEGKLEAIIKGYVDGARGDAAEFKGFIYTKDNEIPFAFFSKGCLD